MNPTGASSMLARARAAAAAGDFRAVAAMLSPQPSAALFAEPELGVLLANARYRTGERESALDLLMTLERDAAWGRQDALWRQQLNLRAAVQYELGDLESAISAWQRLIESAAIDGDELMMARGHTNLGVTRLLRGDFAAALADFTRALAAYARLGDRRGLAQAYQNLGIACRELGLPQDADSHFERAVEYARAARSIDVQARAEEERALLHYLRGDVQLARSTANRARERFIDSADRPGEGEALRVLGIIALGEGLLDDAQALLNAALDAALASKQVLLEAEILEARALLADLHGDHRADEHRLRATALFAQLGASAWGNRQRASLLAIRARKTT